MLESLREGDKYWLALALAGEVAAYAGYMLAFRTAVRTGGGPRLGLGLTARIAFAAQGAFVAVQAVGGLAVDYWALRKLGLRRHEAVTRILGLQTLLYAAFGLAAFLAALVLLLGPDTEAPAAMALPWLVLIPACFLAAGWVASPRRSGRLTRRRGRGRLGKAFADAVGGVVLVRGLVAGPLQHVEGLAGAGLYWAGDMLCLWASLRAFGVQAGLAPLVLAYSTGYVATLLPLPAGGAGGIDASITFALTAVGVPLAPALLGTFAYRFFAFWLEIVPAVAVAPTVPGLSRELRAMRSAHEHGDVARRTIA